MTVALNILRFGGQTSFVIQPSFRYELSRIRAPYSFGAVNSLERDDDWCSARYADALYFLAIGRRCRPFERYDVVICSLALHQS